MAVSINNSACFFSIIPEQLSLLSHLHTVMKQASRIHSCSFPRAPALNSLLQQIQLHSAVLIKKKMANFVSVECNLVQNVIL